MKSPGMHGVRGKGHEGRRRVAGHVVLGPKDEKSAGVEGSGREDVENIIVIARGPVCSVGLDLLNGALV